jgi:hypothetical protein
LALFAAWRRRAVFRPHAAENACARGGASTTSGAG